MKKPASWKRYTPTVFRHWRCLVAGMLWSVVGLGLCVTACSWFSELEWAACISGALAGFGSGVLIYRFGFSRIARKNIDRISGQPERACLFSFQEWRSYLLIALMVLLGQVLKHSHISTLVLATVYSGIGTALTLSSSLYYQRLP